LASGRPVIAQETGYSRVLPTGRGLFAVSNVEQAAAAIQSLDGDYMGHARDARLLAEEHFDSDKVLNRLLDLVSSCP
jgi:glycosyltransferase involved in cell wall biosynthesis